MTGAAANKLHVNAGVYREARDGFASGSGILRTTNVCLVVDSSILHGIQ